MASYYVNKRPSGAWRIIEQVYVSGKGRIRKAVPVKAYASLGIDHNWSIERARERIKQMNSINILETRKRINGARRLLADAKIESTYLPPTETSAFESQLNEISSSKAHEKKLIIQWRFIQRLIASLSIDPADFYDNRLRIYKYFQEKQISISYCEKLIYVLNLWGKFVCRARKLYYEPVETPTGVTAQRIKAANRKGKTYRGASDPLTPLLLSKIRMPNRLQFNWLFVSVWFGLRPEEINAAKWRVEHQDGVDVLWVYQSKLTSIDEAQRWKPIPAIYPEQGAALEMIQEGALEQPLNKVLKAAANGKVTCYGGRKGFTDLMLSLGQKLEDISVWLGHRSIERTWKSYKNKQRVSFTKVS